VIKTLEEGFKELKLPYSKDIENNFIIYRDLLKEWNKKINITSIENDEGNLYKAFY